MKKLVLFVLFTFSVVILTNAQELKVLEFRADISMTDAMQYPKEDFNNERCGLVKLGLVLPDATFEGDIVSLEYKDGEWWIYMSRDANWLTIKSSNYLPLRCEFEDYGIKGIQSNVTYVMTIVSNSEYIKNSSAIWRSAILPGWGQFYKNRNGRGTLIVIGETLTLAAGGLSLYNELTQKSIKDNPEESWENQNAAEENYNRWNLSRHISFGLAGVIYLLNLADAYFTPAKPQKNIAFSPNVINVDGELAVGATMIINF